MNTLDDNRYTEAWRAFGESVGRPRAILAISAHWYINATAVTSMARPRVIHDFYGFPDELFAFDYPAPGDPELASQIVEIVKPRWVGLDHDSWGLDHGTWSVLAHAFPDADIPVVQLSINGFQPPEYHFDIGARLAPLCDLGVLIVGSGNVVHNLGSTDASRPESGFDWAERFDDAAKELMLGAPERIVELEEHPDVKLAVPTPDHFLPLVYLAGVAAALGTKPDLLIEGYSYGALSMTAYTLGGEQVEVAETTYEAAGVAEFPDPDVVPADETNA